MKQATTELESREKGMLKAETSAQAQAQLQELLHNAGAANGIDIRGIEEMRIKPFGNDYGEASVTVRFTCLIEQLVNLLASLANQPELLSTNQIQISAAPTRARPFRCGSRFPCGGQETGAGEEDGARCESQIDVVNAVLALVVIYGGVQLHSQYQAAKAREAALRKARISQAAAPPFYPLANDTPVLASGYADVAVKESVSSFAQSRDRERIRRRRRPRLLPCRSCRATTGR